MMEFRPWTTRYEGDPRFDEVLKDVDLYVSVALSLAEGKDFLPQLDTPEKFSSMYWRLWMRKKRWT